MPRQYNGVDSEVFKDEEDASEFEKMVESAKEEQPEFQKSMMDKLKEFLSSLK